MKITRRLSSGIDFEVEGTTEAELFRQLAKLEETFGEKACGLCAKTDLKFQTRNVSKQEGKKTKNYEYFEMLCTSCGARLAYGQHMEGGTLFPKRKGEDGKFDYQHRGWSKFSRKQEQEQSESTPEVTY